MHRIAARPHTEATDSLPKMASPARAIRNSSDQSIKSHPDPRKCQAMTTPMIHKIERNHESPIAQAMGGSRGTLRFNQPPATSNTTNTNRIHPSPLVVIWILNIEPSNVKITFPSPLSVLCHLDFEI
jgi:hypothetical protein